MQIFRPPTQILSSSAIPIPFHSTTPKKISTRRRLRRHRHRPPERCCWWARPPMVPSPRGGCPPSSPAATAVAAAAASPTRTRSSPPAPPPAPPPPPPRALRRRRAAGALAAAGRALRIPATTTATEDPVLVGVTDEGVPLEGVIQFDKPGDAASESKLVSYAYVITPPMHLDPFLVLADLIRFRWAVHLRSAGSWGFWPAAMCSASSSSPR